MFAGIVVRAGGGDPRDHASAEILLGALTPYGQADRTGSWQGEGALLVQALTCNTPESRHEAVPELCAETGRVIVGWMRLDNRAELCASLGLDLRETLTDPQLVLAAHRAWGSHCAERLEGDFAFAIHDPATRETFCARDALGVRPFFYHASRDLFVFASTAAVFPALSRFDAAPSREWTARFLAGESADPVLAAYENVRKLAPAHSLTLGREGAAQPSRYFAFADTAEFASRRDRKWVDAYREAFHRAVEVRLRSAWPIGVENSGGIDSATIIAHAASRMAGGGAALTGFGVSHLEQEGEYIEALAQHCALGENIVIDTPAYRPPREDETRALRTLGHPPEHTHALFHTPFLAMCRERGIRTLLSGFGGDEMVTSQAEFLPRELLLRREWRALLDTLPGNPAARAARMARLWQRGPSGGMGEWVTARLARTILRREVVEEYLPYGFGEKKAAAFAGARTVNEHLLAKPSFRDTLTGRLEGCSLIAQSYGVDYRWPMLDRALIAQYLRTPAIEKRYRQWGRYLHRRACDGTVPHALLWKHKSMGGFVAFDPERIVPDIRAEELPLLLAELVDPTALAQQREVLSRSCEDESKWVVSAAERNNLRSLQMLDNWMSHLTKGS